jgi:nitrite reductase/ring-hydroxylating ferredoxin subunit
MSDIFAGLVDEFEPDVRIVVRHRNTEIGVFRHEGQFHAFTNRCLHQGGPVCEGIVIGKVETRLADDRRDLGRRIAAEKPHLVCPWHAWEFDLATGEFAGDTRLRLRKFDVRVEDDRVFVVV